MSNTKFFVIATWAIFIWVTGFGYYTISFIDKKGKERYNMPGWGDISK